MANNSIIVTGLEQYQQTLAKMQTDNPRIKKELQAIIRRAIVKARKNVEKDAQGILENDPRHAYKAVRNSVYKQILGGQINILSSSKRGEPTSYKKPITLQQGQRGGNRRKRSYRTMQVESYEGKDRGFILRFLNAGTTDRLTRYGNRGHLTARRWFSISSGFQMNDAADRIAEEIEKLTQQEFQLI
jgi:hypothetical protein